MSSPKEWAFAIGADVSIAISGEAGHVEGRAEYGHGALDSFYVEYVAADGRAQSGWFRADELTQD